MENTTPLRLAGQVAVVTGASSGIGQAIAIGLGHAGVSVIVNYHSDEEGAEQTRRQIEEAGGKSLAVKADVGKEDEVERMFDAALQQFGRLDILVNNAGVQQDAALLDMTLEQWQQVIDTNLTGPFLCARAAARIFTAQKPDEAKARAAGNILFISSVHDIIPWAGHVNYATTKGGIMMMMKTMAQELAPHRIRVNSISPGAIKTDINDDVWTTKEGREQMLKLIPYGRIGEPEDVARVAVWLLSDASDYVTGTTLYVDGGMTLFPEFAKGG
jgi:glucose 1-dehydrogenase